MTKTCAWCAFTFGSALSFLVQWATGWRSIFHDWGHALGKWSADNNAVWLDVIVVGLAVIVWAAIAYGTVVCISRSIRAVVSR